jgi:hypothetical protein
MAVSSLIQSLARLQNFARPPRPDTLDTSWHSVDRNAFDASVQFDLDQRSAHAGGLADRHNFSNFAALQISLAISSAFGTASKRPTDRSRQSGKVELIARRRTWPGDRD